jgi:hypothetical protein
MSYLCSCGLGDPHLSECCPFLDLIMVEFVDQSMIQEVTNEQLHMHSKIDYHGERAFFIFQLSYQLRLPLIDYQHPRSNELIDQSFITAPAAADASYMLDPLLGANQVFHAPHGKCLYETFDDGFNASHLGNVAPSPSYQLNVDTTVANYGNAFSPASSEATLCPSATGQYLSEPSPMQLRDSAPRVVGSDAMRTVSDGRRKKDPKYFCDRPGCIATFTAQHNLNYHKNAHDGKRPYKCLYRYLGCDYAGAAAPRTAKRHSLACKYNMKKHA